MTDIQQRIAAVLSKHFPVDAGCFCGPIESLHPVFVTEYDHADHVAQVLTKELQFRLESQHIEGEWGFFARDESRWVTPWEER